MTAADDLATPAVRANSGAERRNYTISDLAKEFGVTARTLRFYEDKGLLHPARKGQSRIYSYRDRVRLKLVLQGKRVGFSLAEIRELLDLYDLRDGQVTQLRAALRKFDERIAVLERQKAEIEQTLADLTRTRDVVSGMLRERERSGRAGTDD